MSDFTIVTTVYNQYELLRQLIESILSHLDENSYQEIIVVDDYSNTAGKLREYENYLGSNYKNIKIINFNESRPTVYTWTNQINIDGTDFKEFTCPTKGGMGPPLAVKLGLMNVNTKYALIVDTDIIFLAKAKTIFPGMEKCFNKYPNAMALGQIYGEKTHEIKEIKVPFPAKTVDENCYPRGGWPGPTAFACRMAGFHEHDLVMMNKSNPLKTGTYTGWAHTYYMKDLFSKGFSTCNFPLYSKGYLLHLGRGTTKALPGRAIHNVGFGYCLDFEGRYGGRLGKDILWDWYCGYYILNMPSSKYLKYLKEKYDKPFGQIQPPIDEGNMVIELGKGN